jgi:hypothetical protein
MRSAIAYTHTSASGTRTTVFTSTIAGSAETMFGPAISATGASRTDQP